MLIDLLQDIGYVDKLRATGNPQDEARAENVEELVSVAKEFDKQHPDGTLVDFLTEVALVAAADEIDDESGVVSLMTLHTAKGLEFDVVFITGVEEQLLPHRMSADEPGGLAEERRLFYVGITRARKLLHLTLAMQRTTFGESAPSLPSRFLQEVPDALIDWRQPPGMPQTRQLGSSGFGGSARTRESAQMPAGRGLKGTFKPTRENQRFANRVTGAVRDNSALELATGDRVKHTDFGEGTVRAVLGAGAKRIAEIDFDEVGRKKLLIKIAPIEKL